MATYIETFSIGDGANWSFMNGPWTDREGGELRGPDNDEVIAAKPAENVTWDDYSGAHMAVRHDRSYDNFMAKFRLRFRYSHGGARLVFRVQDSYRYYALDIPWCGQQNRNRHMWAGIVIADGTPLQRYLDFRLMTEIVPMHDHWYTAKVQCEGPRIRAWLDGRLVADLMDDTYQAGRIGVMGIKSAGLGCDTDFASLQVEGQSFDAGAWEGLTPPVHHWILPCPKTDSSTFQGYPGIVKSKSGELTVSIPYQDPNGGELKRIVWVRSSDAGRTWSMPVPATLNEGFNGFVKQDGTWVALHSKPGGTLKEVLYTYESSDEGCTWQGPQTLNIVGDWPEELEGPFSGSGQPLRLRNGTLLVPLMTQQHIGSYVNAKVSTNYVLRSTDDGRTWQAPVWCDRNNFVSPDLIFCTGNISEMGMAETDDNVVIGYGRPGPWPYMWRVSSNDGGKTWQPACFGAFPGYCSTLTSTVSGSLVAVHRFPYLAANVSHDGGITWDHGTIIDYPIWANHQAVEVEPDVVLVNSMGYIAKPGQADRRVYRLRVTPRGLVVDP